MDLETENRIAVILMREAAELRRQADKEGLSAYLRDPKSRCRPNSRFLTATVLGVQQANRAVEINEMWRVRQKEKELEECLNKRTRSEGHSDRTHSNPKRHKEEKTESDSCSTRRYMREDFSPREDEGLKDEELEEFLRTRVKRGRGTIGSRMDEPGPYLPSTNDAGLSLTSSESNFRERWESRILGPEKPTQLICNKEIVFKEGKSTRLDKKSSKRSIKHSKKHKLKEKSKDEKKKKKDKKRKKHRDID